MRYKGKRDAKACDAAGSSRLSMSVFAGWRGIRVSAMLRLVAQMKGQVVKIIKAGRRGARVSAMLRLVAQVEDGRWSIYHYCWTR